MKYINPIIWKVLAAIRLDASVKLLIRSALLDDGWFRSYHDKQAVDKAGNPIPWYTYPFLHFIKSRLKWELRTLYRQMLTHSGEKDCLYPYRTNLL